MITSPPAPGRRTRGWSARRKAAASRRRERRAAELANVVPIRLYGLRRGTVTALTVCAGLFALFILAPLAWLVVNATKTQSNVLQHLRVLVRPAVRPCSTTSRCLTQSMSGSGVYLQWMGNTALYAALGAGGATVLCALAGYGFARYRFRGSNALST